MAGDLRIVGGWVLLLASGIRGPASPARRCAGVLSEHVAQRQRRQAPYADDLLEVTSSRLQTVSGRV
jgi:hypothetical protein